MIINTKDSAWNNSIYLNNQIIVDDSKIISKIKDPSNCFWNIEWHIENYRNRYTVKINFYSSWILSKSINVPLSDTWSYNIKLNFVDRLDNMYLEYWKYDVVYILYKDWIEKDRWQYPIFYNANCNIVWWSYNNIWIVDFWNPNQDYNIIPQIELVKKSIEKIHFIAPQQIEYMSEDIIINELPSTWIDS